MGQYKMHANVQGKPRFFSKQQNDSYSILFSLIVVLLLWNKGAYPGNKKWAYPGNKKGLTMEKRACPGKRGLPWK